MRLTAPSVRAALPVAIVLSLGSVREARGAVVDEADVEKLHTTLLPLVEEAAGEKFDKPVPFRIVTQPDIAKSLDADADRMHPEGKKEPPQAAAARHAQNAQMSFFVMGKFVFETGTVDIVPGNFERAAQWSAMSQAERDGYLALLCAHETAHALQAQRYKTADRLPHLDDYERRMCFQAVTEGHANFVMYKVSEKLKIDDAVVRMAHQGAAGMPVRGGADQALAWQRSQNAFSYDQGCAFFQAIEKKGGLKAVRAVFGRFPEWTEDILHPDRYLEAKPKSADVLNLKQALAGVGAALPGKDWIPLADTYMGEACYRAILAGMGIAPGDIDKAVAGLEGARMVRFGGPGRQVEISVMRFESAAALKAFDAVQKAAQQRFVKQGIAQVVEDESIELAGADSAHSLRYRQAGAPPGAPEQQVVTFVKGTTFGTATAAGLPEARKALESVMKDVAWKLGGKAGK